jgi:hypothetical protein
VNRTLIVSAVLICLVTTLAIGAMTTPVKATDANLHFTSSIPAGSHWSTSWPNLAKGSGIYGSFSVGSGLGINFFICNSANYTLYTSNKSYS